MRTKAASFHKNHAILKAFIEATPKRRKILVEDLELINFFKLCCRNFLKGNLTQHPRIISKLDKYKNTIRKLASGKRASKSDKSLLKREISTQRGGFLQFLLPLALSAITSLIGRGRR